MRCIELSRESAFEFFTELTTRRASNFPNSAFDSSPSDNCVLFSPEELCWRAARDSSEQDEDRSGPTIQERRAQAVLQGPRRKTEVAEESGCD